MKRVLILDLDNTIYPVSSIASDVFDSIYQLIDEEVGQKDHQAATQAKAELTRRPYQQVAEEHGFSEVLKTKGNNLLRNLEYDKPIECYPEYQDLRAIDVDKYLVTKGFTKLQNSKFRMLDIYGDFKECIVVDPERSDLTKKDIFVRIMQENGYAAEDVLVIGDDPESEIKAAVELGIETFLFDPGDMHPHANVTYRGKDYKQVAGIVKGK